MVTARMRHIASFGHHGRKTPFSLCCCDFVKLRAIKRNANVGHRPEPAARDVVFVSERIGWLPFAGRFRSVRSITSHVIASQW